MNLDLRGEEDFLVSFLPFSIKNSTCKGKSKYKMKHFMYVPGNQQREFIRKETAIFVHMLKARSLLL